MSNAAPDTGRLDPARAGLAAVSGYAIWGLSPLFYMLLDFTSAAEIVLHRAIWSAPVLLAMLLMAKRWGATLAVLTDRKALMVLLLTAILIGANWWLFIFAVNSGRVLEVSLGYFINPLMHIAVGVFVLNERFGRWRALAVGLAALGVLNQVITVGEPPILALFLAVSFTAYAYIRKTIAVDGRIGLFWETVLIAIPSLPAIIFLEASGGGHFFDGWSQALLLILTGPMTVAPLLLFIVGARGLSLAVIGVAQFLAPSIQFAVGLATGEAFGWANAATFGLIWAGLAVFVFDLVNFERKAAKLKDSPS
jgi:chloramphenicol-sensitive protein RarD